MRIAVSATGAGLEGETSRTFGRCPRFVFLDTETMACETLENPSAAASGGAGIQAAEFVIRHGAEAVVTGGVGPNASRVLEAAGVTVYLPQGSTVAEAAQAFRDGVLSPAPETTGPSGQREAEPGEPAPTTARDGRHSGRVQSDEGSR